MLEEAFPISGKEWTSQLIILIHLQEWIINIIGNCPTPHAICIMNCRLKAGNKICKIMRRYMGDYTDILRKDFLNITPSVIFIMCVTDNA